MIRVFQELGLKGGGFPGEKIDTELSHSNGDEAEIDTELSQSNGDEAEIDTELPLPTNGKFIYV